MTSAAPEVRPDPSPVPPEERFWRRYSPHHEASLSGAGSLTLHFLVVGLLILTGYLGWLSVGHTPRKMKNDVLQLEDGAGPGAGAAVGDGRGAPGGADERRESVTSSDQPVDDASKAPPTERKALPGVAPPKVDVEPPADRPLPDVDRQHLLDDVRALRDASARMKGTPSPSSAAANDRTNDDRKANPGGGGPSGGLRNQPVPRTLRWDLRFNTNDGRDYLRQLEGLGAVLAIPTGSGDAGYKVVRELSRRPVRLLDEDVSTLKGICWRDEEPRSVAAVMAALGLNLRPTHFAAFFPAELEEKLARLEREFANRGENEIYRTRFRVFRSGARYEVAVADQEPLR